jgi:hypothetical protein
LKRLRRYYGVVVAGTLSRGVLEVVLLGGTFGTGGCGGGGAEVEPGCGVVVPAEGLVLTAPCAPPGPRSSTATKRPPNQINSMVGEDGDSPWAKIVPVMAKKRIKSLFRKNGLV